MNKTSIAWTERTWNPVTGCTKYSAGCAHCYAETITRRFPKAFPNGFSVTLHPERLDEPKHIKKPTMFFVCSMGDLFHSGVPIEFVDSVMKVIKETPQHTYQVLSKRDVNMNTYFYTRGVPNNCWVGMTVENEDAKSRIEWLQTIEAPVRFLSCEPLLSDLGTIDLTDIDWVIVGGESGNQARPIKKEWVLNIKRQCDAQGIPFFFKQWGTYGEDGVKRDKKANGCTINGQIYQAWPKGWEGGK